MQLISFPSSTIFQCLIFGRFLGLTIQGNNPIIAASEAYRVNGFRGEHMTAREIDRTKQQNRPHLQVYIALCHFTNSLQLLYIILTLNWYNTDILKTLSMKGGGK